MSCNSQMLKIFIIMIFTVLLLVRTFSCCYFLHVNTFYRIVFCIS